MVHPDHETRVAAHRIFSVVLVPSSVCPNPTPITVQLKKALDLPRALSRTVSVFSSSAALFDKLRNEADTTSIESKEKVVGDGGSKNLGMMSRMKSKASGDGSKKNLGIMSRLKSSYSRVHSIKNPPPAIAGNDKDSVSKISKELVSAVCFFVIHSKFKYAVW